MRKLALEFSLKYWGHLPLPDLIVRARNHYWVILDTEEKPVSIPAGSQERFRRILAFAALAARRT